MIKEIVTDEFQLSIPSIHCENSALIEQCVQDLIDTADAHRGKCAGLAANQIGYQLRIFIIISPAGPIPFINPEVACFLGSKVYGKHPYEACLSRPNKPHVKVKRYKELKLKLTDHKTGDEAFLKCKGRFARVVQHELDHLNGVLI